MNIPTAWADIASSESANEILDVCESFVAEYRIEGCNLDLMF